MEHEISILQYPFLTFLVHIEVKLKAFKSVNFFIILKASFTPNLKKTSNQAKHYNKAEVSNVLSLTEVAELEFASHIPHSFNSENV